MRGPAVYGPNACRARLTMSTNPNVKGSSAVKRGNGYLYFKRVQDIVLSLLGLIILVPVMLLISLIIVIESPGESPIFVQNRVGKDGKIFRFFKFRTMYPDAEAHLEQLLAKNEMNGPVFKIKDDPRITRVGKIIRKLSIDELPQFFNIFFGSMSLVGTRPPTLDEVEKYKRDQWRRISIKPGLTGMWQVNGRSNIQNFDEIVELDVEYIDNWSLFLDIKILLKTVWVILARKGAC